MFFIGYLGVVVCVKCLYRCIGGCYNFQMQYNGTSRQEGIEWFTCSSIVFNQFIPPLDGGCIRALLILSFCLSYYS